MKHEITTLEILFNLLMCLLTFYGLYYLVLSVCYGAFRLPKFDGRAPFDFQHWVDLQECCTSYTDQQIVNWVAMEVTYFLCAMIMLAFIRRRIWDYVLTVSLIHLIFSSIAMTAFPTNWSWWLCLALTLLSAIGPGEAVLYCCRHRASAKQISFMESQKMDEVAHVHGPAIPGAELEVPSSARGRHLHTQLKMSSRVASLEEARTRLSGLASIHASTSGLTGTLTPSHKEDCSDCDNEEDERNISGSHII